MKNPSTIASYDTSVMHFYARFLRLIGVLPFEGGNKFVNALIVATFVFSAMVHWSMFVVFALKQDKLDLDTICETVFVTGIDLRYVILLLRRRRYAGLVQDCREIWRDIESDEHQVILAFESKIRTMFKVLIGIVMSANIVYSGTALVKNYAFVRDNSTEEQWHKVLPYKWYVNDADAYWPGYEAVFVFQFLVIVNINIITPCIDTATPLLMMLNSGYLRVLQTRFRSSSAVNRVGSSNDSEYIISCVKLHQKIYAACEKIERLASVMFLIQMLSNGYNTSLIMIRVLNAKQDRYKFLPVFALSISQLFICQYAPDFLVDESKAVTFAAYTASVPWMRRRFGKLFTIILARSQRPVQMTAGGIVNLSLESFGSMLSTVVSFFTVLRNFSD